MKTTGIHTTTSSSHAQQQVDSQPFFQPDREQDFFGNERAAAEPFFSSINMTAKESSAGSGFETRQIQRKYADYAIAEKIQPKNASSLSTSTKDFSLISNESVIQRDETPTDNAPDKNANQPGKSRVKACQFPDFRCLTSSLKLDVDENLKANAHQFFRVAALHPQDSELMTKTFMRYGLGVNHLQTTFGFMGFKGNWRDIILPYGTGVALKAATFATDGLIELDIPIEIGDQLLLNFQFDMQADPANGYRIQAVQGMVGLSKKF